MKDEMDGFERQGALPVAGGAPQAGVIALRQIRMICRGAERIPPSPP